jgi:hypothetical protein
MNDEQREEFLGKLCDTIVDGMSLAQLETTVWDKIYDELVGLNDSDLELFAEDYGVEL